jgi:hypothetical protein
MKKRSFILIGLFFFAPFSNAQNNEHDPTETDIKNDVENLVTKLNLSNEQKTKIIQLSTDHVLQVKTMIEMEMTPNEVIPDKERYLRKKLDARILAVLSDEQKKRYKQYLEDTKP